MKQQQQCTHGKLPAEATPKAASAARTNKQQAHYKRRLTLAILIAAAIIFITSSTLLLGVAYANWVVDDDSNTEVTTVVLDVDVLTNTNATAAQFPGADITRSVQVKNTGNTGIFVRIKVATAFEDGEGNIIEDTAGLIKVTYDTTHWKDGQDGYFYLMGVLEPGVTSADCISKIELSTSIPGNYAGYSAIVNPQAYALQTTASAITAVWGKTYEFMESHQKDPRQKGEAHVAFVNPTTGFVFTPTTKDLFPAAKDLTPGESITHAIEFTNAYSEEVAIDVTSGTFTPTNISNLFAQYATLTIKDQKGVLVFEGPAAGSAWDAFTSTITLAPGQSTFWTATLTIQAHAPNDLQGIDTAILSWDLSAHKPVDPPGPTPGPTPGPSNGGTSPRTGDNPLLILLAFAVFTSGAVLIVVGRTYQKQRRR